MENSTKALIIAGTVLIAIVMVSIAVYLYSIYSNQSKEYNEIMSSVELQKFNSKFVPYVGRTDITAQEIASLVSISKEYNNQVNIYLDGGIIQFDGTNTPEVFIKNKQNSKFSCNSNTNLNIYDANGKVTELKFTTNTP